MTLPDERYRALLEGMKLIQDLSSPSVTPRVPKDVRERVRWVLRHYPSAYDMRQIAVQATDILSTTGFNGKEIE